MLKGVSECHPVKFCTYCGGAIMGEVAAPGYEGELVFFDGDIETVVSPGSSIGFCDDRCAWRYGIESHKASGMPGKLARRHLIEEHGLISPAGKNNDKERV
ncbi:hypothetical protein ES705_38905 [subsurface metagenome]